MDRCLWMLTVGAALGGNDQTWANVSGVIAAIVVCNIPGVIGILLTIRSGSARSAILLQMPFLIISATAAITGLVLLAAGPTPVTIGLIVGGAAGVLESAAFMLVAVVIARQRQAQKTGNPR